jgi:hypothetical protein
MGAPSIKVNELYFILIECTSRIILDATQPPTIKRDSSVVRILLKDAVRLQANAITVTFGPRGPNGALAERSFV